jgi:hypothetical protein
MDWDYDSMKVATAYTRTALALKDFDRKFGHTTLSPSARTVSFYDLSHQSSCDAHRFINIWSMRLGTSSMGGDTLSFNQLYDVGSLFKIPYGKTLIDIAEQETRDRSVSDNCRVMINNLPLDVAKKIQNDPERISAGKAVKTIVNYTFMQIFPKIGNDEIRDFLVPIHGLVVYGRNVHPANLGDADSCFRKFLCCLEEVYNADGKMNLADREKLILSARVLGNAMRSNKGYLQTDMLPTDLQKFQTT